MKNKFLRYLFLSLALLSNSFTIVYSALPSDVTDKWTSNIANFFTRLVNSVTEKEVVNIPMKELNVFISHKDSYKYNDIPGYSLNQIPLGSAKQVECSFLPEDTSDSSIQFYTEEDNVVLNQSGNTVSVVGMGAGVATIYAKNKASGLVSSCQVEVIDAVEPKSFTIGLESNEIEINGLATIEITIDGGVLGDGELVNSRYYDTRRLDFSSSNENVCIIDNYGVIHPLSLGSSTITVSNSSGCEEHLDVTVIDGGVKPVYTNLNIVGSDVCYDNDMIKDQSSGKNHYQLDIYDGEDKLDPHDFYWTSSDELLARVDKHGVLRGFRKKSTNDENVTITATSKYFDNQSVSFDVTVKEQLPSSMYYSITVGSKVSWNTSEFTACVGDKVSVNVGYDIGVSNKSITVSISDSDMADLTVQGSSFILYIKTTGSLTATFHSNINPELTGTISFELLKAGAISTGDIKNVGHSLRKTIGHSMMFAIAQVFTLITIMLFLNKKNIWVCVSISLVIGFVFSSISEIVQIFAPGRQGTFLDVLINFSGVSFGAIAVVIVVIVREIIKNRKQLKNKVS